MVVSRNAERTANLRNVVFILLSNEDEKQLPTKSRGNVLLSRPEGPLYSLFFVVYFRIYSGL